MIQQVMLGKKWTWFGNDHSLNFHVQVSGVSRGCQESPASLSLSVDSMSLHCLSFEENGFRPPPSPPLLMSPLKGEFSMNLSVYFIRWLLFIGAFWLHSAHLGSLRVGWHVPHITWGSSHLKTTLQLWLQKPHPGTH